jgi:thymidylate synthase (FAD)
MRIPILDHGYIELIEPWGTGRAGKDKGPTNFIADYEVGLIEAARQSTQGSFRGWDQDSKLLKHLYENNHATPFEFAGMVIEVQAPIFVFREWHRHRTQSYNEMSARYAPLPDLYYTPTVERILMDGGKNKQAQSVDGVPLSEGTTAERFCDTHLQQVYRLAEEVYQSALAAGIPKELARLVMPVGHYSRMRASANLRNWLAFMTLRCDPLAQWEIRQYANAVSDCIWRTFPLTYALWATR